jgi:hypothetical protein
MNLPTAQSGEFNHNGTIKIRKKSGDWAEKAWYYSYKIIE